MFKHLSIFLALAMMVVHATAGDGPSGLRSGEESRPDQRREKEEDLKSWSWNGAAEPKDTVEGAVEGGEDAERYENNQPAGRVVSRSKNALWSCLLTR